MIEAELYQQGKTIYEIAEVVGIGSVGVWKRLKKQKVKMRSSGTRKGNHWAVNKRGKEYQDKKSGYYWVRGIQYGKKSAKKRAMIVMEEKLGKPIPKGYHVHHIDEDVTNDSIENLKLMVSKEHSQLHHLGKPNWKKNGHKNRSKY